MASFKLFTKWILKAHEELADKVCPKKLNLVIGNEAADLDSMVSAVAFSYYLSFFPSPNQEQNIQNGTTIPVFSINQSSLRLRQDCKYVLDNFLSFEVADKKEQGQKETLGFFLDQLDYVFEIFKSDSADVPDSSKNVYLVDHNVIKPDFAYLSKYVKGIVDHHSNEHKYTHLDINSIQKVGSCTSLVIQMLKSRFDELSIVNYSDAMPLNLVMALMAPILIDTHNMEASDDKVTPIDRDSLDWLLEILSFYKQNLEALIAPNTKADTLIHPLGFSSSKKFFKHLSALKKDTSTLSINELLDKDYKEINPSDINLRKVKIGVSSVPDRLATMVTSHGVSKINKGLLEVLAAKNLDILVLMTHGSLKNEFKESVYGKEIVILFDAHFCHALAQQVLTKLINDYDLALSPFILPHENNIPNNINHFTQSNTKASRKQVIPILNKIISELQDIGSQL